jgi:hypothetical protein
MLRSRGAWRIDSARYTTDYFVGREPELDAFRTALQSNAPDHPVSLLFVHGPGGVGKRVLPRQFGRLATDARARVIALDGRDLEPSPSGVLGAVRELAGIGDSAALFDALAHRERLVLLIDTYEALTPLDTWMRELFLPQLPEASLVDLSRVFLADRLALAIRVDAGVVNAKRGYAIVNTRHRHRRRGRRGSLSRCVPRLRWRIRRGRGCRSCGRRCGRLWTGDREHELPVDRIAVVT